MGFQDMADADTTLGGQVEDSVDIPLRIDDDRRPAVGDQVAAIAQSRCLDDLYPHTSTVGRSQRAALTALSIISVAIVAASSPRL